jgi:hypothetical protein
LLEEEERKKQQEAASREKLRLLDARTRPIQIQTHETSARETGGKLKNKMRLEPVVLIETGFKICSSG